jgi:hypothetical protein
MNELVQRLSEGRHPVATERYKSAAELKERIDRGFVLVKFTGTQGGTELGVQLDAAETQLDKGDFQGATGTVRLAGGLTLNYVKVKCVADIDLATLKGEGYLVPVAEEEPGQKGQEAAAS